MSKISSSNVVADQHAREQALDIRQSFIVQAPAGSGKTGLIVQRYLVLLARVKEPEEIIAITFTRKAAGEMRERIIEVLRSAQTDPAPDNEHARYTWNLAKQALKQNSDRGWCLLEQPARLRIQTIDSLCAMLARQMPMLSNFGATPEITDRPDELYQIAAINTIAELETGEGWSDAVAHLVAHLDNRLDRLQALLVSMLARRDQWLRHVADPEHPRLERANMESALNRAIESVINEVVDSVPDGLGASLIPLIHFAAGNLSEDSSVIAGLQDTESLPGANLEDLSVWGAIAELMLTGEGKWRKVSNKSQGFLSPGEGKTAEEKVLFKEMKSNMTELLKSMSEKEAFRLALYSVKGLAGVKYRESDWETLEALFDLLRLSAAQLEVVFREKGQVDYAGMSQAAARALGTSEEPTDLALALDYRINHLLVDEFQDTSFNQYTLLERLTAGWVQGDGRTMFLVGDPMQSIYRFREAEVGLFLEAREQGIGQVKLTPLQLEVNFRSQQGIVDWINRHFPSVLAKQDDIVSGAVLYAASKAHHKKQPGSAVTIHPFIGRNDHAEAEKILTLIQEAKEAHPDGTTAVLVRGRTHLVEILKQLNIAGARFRAVEIESLAHCPVIQDLLALTRCLLHTADRVAWLSVLRAPWCGLTLADLHTLVSDEKYRTVPDLLQDANRRAQISQDGRDRLESLWFILHEALASRLQQTLRQTVEGVWLAIGGPATVENETDLEDAEVYLQLLDELDDARDLSDLDELEKQVAKLFSLPDVNADESLQIMTLHKSKGLEFDTVIIPGLGRSPGSGDPQLLYWMERPLEFGGSDLVLAPIKKYAEDENPIASFLQEMEKEKCRYEYGRILYVGATRAKGHLHLLGHVNTKKSKQKEPELSAPPKDTLLASLWPVVKNDFVTVFSHWQAPDEAPGSEIAKSPAVIKRVPGGWKVPAPSESVLIESKTSESPMGEQVEFSWAGENAKCIGTVVHRLLQEIGRRGVETIVSDSLDHLCKTGRILLSQSGIPQAYLDASMKRVVEALEGAVTSERGRWLLSSAHTEIRSEYPLTAVQAGRVHRMVLDRTFVDELGTRWIIDYKTGMHAGGGLVEFLDSEQERYKNQLEAYARAMQVLDARPIQLGLYFPLIDGWREWSFATNDRV